MRKFSKKTIVLMVSLALLLCMGVGGTLAFLFDASGPVKNTFTPSNVTTSVEETFENGVKSDVSIKNTGDTEAYIRAAVVVSWQNAAGEVYGTTPVAGTDYSITFSTDATDGKDGKWEKKDGFYYWSEPVAPGELTGILITKAEYKANAPEGYALCIEILGSGIQSAGIPEGSHPWGI